MTVKRPKGKLSGSRGMPPHSHFQCLNNQVFQEEPDLQKDFLRTFPEVVG